MDNADEKEVLYDRHKFQETTESRTDMVSSATTDIDGRPVKFPFIDSNDLLSPVSGHLSYLQHMMLSVGKERIPSRIQSIIEESDFTNKDDSSCLFEILKNMKKKCDVMLRDEAKEIETRIENAMHRTLCNLRDMDSPLFKGATAVLLGSATEGTKVNRPDEWDFVIFLPFFSNICKHEFPISENSKDVNIPMEEIEHELYSLTGNAVGYVVNVSYSLKTFICSELEKEMKYMEFTQKHKCDNHDTAVPLTFHHKTSRMEFDIKIDLSVGVRDEENASVALDTTLVRPLEEQPPYGFYIAVDTLFSPTVTFSEVKRMKELSHNRKLCYQVAKCVIDHCLPSCQDGMCKCSRSHIPSFGLKLILFYLCDYYEDDKFWVEEQLTNRILELFIIYIMCLSYGRVNNVLFNGYIPLFDTPIAKHFGLFGSSTRNCCTENDLKQWRNRLSALTNKPNTHIKTFKNYISESLKRDGYVRAVSIITELCQMLFYLKRPNPPKQESHEKYQINGVRGCVADMEYIEQPDGGVLVLTDYPCCLIKYEHPVIIGSKKITGRQVVHPRMCYHEGSVFVFYRHTVARYRYGDLSFVSSTRTQFLPMECKGFGILHGDLSLFIHKDGKIVRTTTEGEEICRSHTTFRYPSHVVINSDNSIAVCCKEEEYITFLSNDMKSTRSVVYTDYLSSPLHFLHMSENSLTGCIFALLSTIEEFVVVNEISKSYSDANGYTCHSERLIMVNSPGTPDLPHPSSVCYDTKRQLLMVGGYDQIKVLTL